MIWKRPDPYYRSRTWRSLRASALLRDGGRCVVCGAMADHVDHIVARKAGGADELANLRSLCALHDNQAHREKGTGAASREARFTRPGVNSKGWPADPAHPWNTEG